MAAAKLTAQERGLGFRLMFQDEARFGRMSLPYSAWAPKPIRPVVDLALVREFSYVYCAASPSDGKTVWALADKMNTEEMGNHLLAVSQQFPDELVLMVVDGASSHKAAALKIPSNIILHVLPPYSPELNPVEDTGDEMREKFFANRIFNSMEQCLGRIKDAIESLGQHLDSMQSLTYWLWIKNANLNLA